MNIFKRNNADLNWLQEWFCQNCNGDWEHDHGIIIRTLDNPGWNLDISLVDTGCEDIIIEDFERQNPNDENDWVVYKIEDNYFKGRCGPLNLKELINYFKVIIENNER